MNRNYNTKTKFLEGVHVCIYCGKIVYGYRTNEFESETYYNCSCNQALLERKMESEIEDIRKRYRNKLRYNRKAIDETAKQIRKRKGYKKSEF